MANKEATVYIVDLGKSTGSKRHGRNQTDLDWALDYVWDKITTTVCIYSILQQVRSNVQQVATGRKTAMMGVVGVRTNETDLADIMEPSEGYENIQVFSEIKQSAHCLEGGSCN
jgi:ATP-dependent DNA helicase 2 subunit 2